jgi:hypothetical protein
MKTVPLRVVDVPKLDKNQQTLLDQKGDLKSFSKNFLKMKKESISSNF